MFIKGESVCVLTILSLTMMLQQSNRGDPRFRMTKNLMADCDFFEAARDFFKGK